MAKECSACNGSGKKTTQSGKRTNQPCDECDGTGEVIIHPVGEDGLRYVSKAVGYVDQDEEYY